MREVNAIISLMGEETEYYVLYSHAPNEAPVWRKTDRRVRSLVTGVATFSQSTLSLKPRKSKSETPVTAGDSGELIRLSVHQVNNELCIILLPWCHHNNKNCLLPHKLMWRMRSEQFQAFGKNALSVCGEVSCWDSGKTLTCIQCLLKANEFNYSPLIYKCILNTKYFSWKDTGDFFFFCEKFGQFRK